MKTERAIELLNRISDSQFDGIHGDERREALSMAERALEQNLGNNGSICTKTGVNDEDRTTDDSISRKMAIDAVKSYWRNEVDRIPKKSTDFDVITQICDSILTHNANICKAIDTLPSVQPERKKGKWIWWYEESFTEHATEYTPHCKCSECGSECAPSVATYSNFCRNCGAYMGDENDAIS